MFWNSNYTMMREVKFLLKEENVTLTQVLEADDILQECKADNKMLIQFLTQPEILAELITLITKESPEDVDLTIQYRYSNIACEVLTSQLSGLSHHLCKNVEQMNRLCDFLNQDPPLNPLLASYFSRTIAALLKRSPKQDCYLHDILCLHALDFFKTRKDFIPNLFKHIATSAIADTFKYLIFYLGQPFSEIVMEWFDKQNFLENLIQIICCTYEPGNIEESVSEGLEKQIQNNVGKECIEENEEEVVDHEAHRSAPTSGSTIGAREAERRRRLAAAASGSACEVACGVAGAWAAGADWADAANFAAWAARLGSEPLLGALLGRLREPGPPQDVALVNACRLLHSLLRLGDEQRRAQVARVIAEHMGALRDALRREPGGGARRRLGAARLQVAALLAELAASGEPAVHAAARAHRTTALLLDLFFDFPDNNFLHAHVCTLLRNLAANRDEGFVYWQWLVGEEDLMTRLMDTFEQNQDKKTARRSSAMGHVTAACCALRDWQAVGEAPGAVRERWEVFLQARLSPLLALLEKPLGGEYPSETLYEVGSAAAVCRDAAYEVGAAAAPPGAEAFGAEMWQDSPAAVLDSDEAAQHAPDPHPAGAADDAPVDDLAWFDCSLFGPSGDAQDGLDGLEGLDALEVAKLTTNLFMMMRGHDDVVLSAGDDN